VIYQALTQLIISPLGFDKSNPYIMIFNNKK